MIWPCLVHYDVVLNSTELSAGYLHGVAVYLEMRQPDAYGDPGKIVSRELVSLTALNTTPGSLPGTLNSRGHHFTIWKETLHRQPAWQEFDPD